jgi:rod shape-determining protein MreD
VTSRRIVIAVVLVVAAVALQTTLFARLRPLDAAPALVLLTVIAVSRRLPDEAALLIGFGAGLFQDLLSESPLGLWALVASAVAFATIRFRDRMAGDYRLIAPAVFVLSLSALALFALLGTIFGEKTLADAGIVRKMVLPALYNTVLAVVVLPLATRLMGRPRRQTGWQL